MNLKRIDYPCGCWYIFNVDNPHGWKVIDYVICDKHVAEILPISESKVKSNGESEA